MGLADHYKQWIYPLTGHLNQLNHENNYSAWNNTAPIQNKHCTSILQKWMQ